VAAPALLVVSTVVVVLQVFSVRVVIPSPTWQFPRSWGRIPGLGYPFAFGASLGVGLLTVVVTAEHYLIFISILALESWIFGAALMACFAVGRTIPYATRAVVVLRGPPVAGARGLAALQVRPLVAYVRVLTTAAMVGTLLRTPAG
jgi:hypothetical protein